MPSVPPTIVDIDAEVTSRCGLVLNDAGKFFDVLDGSAPPVPVSRVVRQGIRKGLKAIGWALQNPLLAQDADLVGVSGFGLERIIDEAELYSLEQCLAGWWRVTQKEQEPLTASPMQGGWRYEQKQAVKGRVAELKQMCSEPYREPTDAGVVTNRADDGFGYGYPYGPGWGCWPC